METLMVMKTPDSEMETVMEMVMLLLVKKEQKLFHPPLPEILMEIQLLKMELIMGKVMEILKL